MSDRDPNRKVSALELDGDRLRKLIALAGSFQDDSFQTVKISGDDATQTWHITTGEQSSYGSSIKEAIDNFPQ